MNTFIDFFALRPVFSFFGLKLVWYIYLLHILLQLYTAFAALSQILSQRGISWEAWSPNALPFILGLVAQVALVRVLLEVAATVLLSRRNAT